MQPLTRARFNQFADSISEAYGADRTLVGTPGASWFTIAGPTAEHYAAGATPAPEQRLVTRMQESTDFLRRINMIGVTQLAGQTIGLNMTNPVASRANTAGTGTGTPVRRQPIDPTGLDNFPYSLAATEFNPLFTYAKLDEWAKFADFEVRMQNAILTRQSLDRIQIGLNGTAVDVSFDPVADPTLAGMNVGWLQWMHNNAPSRVLSAGATAGKVTYGTGGDYANLDALVYDARMNLLPAWARESPDLVAIAGSDIIQDKYFPIINRNEASLDLIAQAALMAGSKPLGFIPSYRVPFMPAGKVLITPFWNLSIYYQTGAMRRMLRDEPQWNRVVDYQSSNEGYVVEDPNFACLVENIEPVAGAAATVAETQATTDHDDASL